MAEIYPGISLCMIVRDEEKKLARSLLSVADFVDEMIVVDTGSTDTTVEIAQSFGARVFFLSWNDHFSEARNFALEQAGYQWVLFLDADEELLTRGDVLRTRIAVEETEGYFFEIISSLNGQELRQPSLRLWRNHSDYRYSGRVHEDIVSSLHRKNPRVNLQAAGVQIKHFHCEGDQERRQKRERNTRLLERACAEEPANLNYRYHLAAACCRGGDYKRAAELFESVLKDVPPDWPRLATLLRNYAVCLVDSGQYENALRVLIDGAARYADYTELYYLQGVVYLEKGEADKAVDMFLRCLDLGEAPPCYVSGKGVGSHKACFMAGRALEQLGVASEAVKAYTVALQLSPEYRPALQALVGIMCKEWGLVRCLEYLGHYFEFATPASLDMLLEAFSAAGAAEAGIIMAGEPGSGCSEETKKILGKAFLLREKEILNEAVSCFGKLPVLEKRIQSVDEVLGLLRKESADAAGGAKNDCSAND